MKCKICGKKIEYNKYGEYSGKIMCNSCIAKAEAEKKAVRKATADYSTVIRKKSRKRTKKSKRSKKNEASTKDIKEDMPTDNIYTNIDLLDEGK